MPLWAYGITTLPQPGDTAKPQGWGRQFNPAIDRDEQLKPVLHLAGSSRTYARIDLSDWANAVDWFPDEHAPMPDVVQHGSAALAKRSEPAHFAIASTAADAQRTRPSPGYPSSIFCASSMTFAAAGDVRPIRASRTFRP